MAAWAYHSPCKLITQRASLGAGVVRESQQKISWNLFAVQFLEISILFSEFRFVERR